MPLSLATILIVDDHEPTLREWKALLKTYALQVLVAERGQQAFEMACQFQPQVIVSDLDMPKMNGFQLLSLLKSASETEQIPVVICSATTDDTSKYLAQTLGAIAYLEKPLQLSQLIAVIEHQLDPLVSLA